MVSLAFRADDVETLPDGRVEIRNVRLVGVDGRGRETEHAEVVESVTVEGGRLVVRVRAASFDDPVWVPGDAGKLTLDEVAAALEAGVPMRVDYDWWDG